MRRARTRPAALVAAIALATTTTAVPAGTTAAAPASGTRPAVFVGNNWDGTADVIDPDDHRRLARIDIVPDRAERMREIHTDPVRLAYFLGIRTLIGEGHDQLVDDMFSTPDGRLLIVSRPSFGDVVAVDLRDRGIAWRFRVAGQRADHMAVSPDGATVAVSASTANVVHLLDTRTGAEVGRFPSGDSPHENNYSRDGRRIYHASIGFVYTPLDHPALDSTKGQRYFQVVDAESATVLRRIDMGKKLAEAGYPNMSSAVRPMAHTADERYFYLQVSFFHGFVEYDMVEDRVTRVAPLPNLVPDLPRERYLLDSAHHGIAMDGTDRTLCVAGTMSDYAAIVDRATFRHTLVPGGEDAKPYWATRSADGRHCYVSWSGTDQVSVISFDTAEEVARIDVGDHPQRIRTGVVPADLG
ncbi:DNA-binding beta-propeller fold protein YncE [Amycolatopsis arida]|uniref:DNA-binding beta-propeller fold protein YncE n=1 Tax=Amycolatopsis arida TaxID=587909 RepID=A0A1I6A7P5_9PSEU|nr:serine/threonine protein kinase [Amycolatopsis arida]TDX88554.1 DNA-binding beta-propeller fold protein YncE [Amycolatopsis arida]SFQ64567.1 DNA-binding beta-propeller fold protein YncE [Amycolatopsis arida]